MGQLGFYINSDACTGCKACELACKDRNNLDVGARLRRVRQVCGGGWTQDEKTGAWSPENVFSLSVSFSCGHCDNPACVEKCPTGAMTKDEATGIVSNDLDVCIGCGACQQMCPYGAPQVYEKEGVARKCDMCRSLTDAGEEPACVGICPQRALAVGDIEELRATYGTVSDTAPLPDSSQTSPNIVIGVHRNAERAQKSARPLSLEE